MATGKSQFESFPNMYWEGVAWGKQTPQSVRL